MKTGPNIRYRADGRWEARYIRGRDGFDRAIMGYCYGKTREEAEQKRSEALIRLKNAAIEHPMSFSEILTGWKERIKHSPQTGTTGLYASMLETYLIPALGGVAINEITPALADECIKNSVAENERGLCYDALRALCEFAIEEGSLSVLPLYEPVDGIKEEAEQSDSLSPAQAYALERALRSGQNRKKLGIYMCLHMGLTVSELCALKAEDIDLAGGIAHIHGSKTDTGERCHGRALPIPAQVASYIERLPAADSSPVRQLISDSDDRVLKSNALHNELYLINRRDRIASNISMKLLRDTFIRRCILNGIDVFTVAAYTGMKSVYEINKHYKDLFKADLKSVCALREYTGAELKSEGNAAPNAALYDSPRIRRMNLLIIGAGDQGQAVREIAEQMGIFEKTAFLDDKSGIEGVIGTCGDYEGLTGEYPIACPSFGNNALRMKWMEKLERAGFILPKLIHPSAMVSDCAVVGRGAVIEAGAVVKVGAEIGGGCIISAGAMIEQDACVGDGCHIDSEATVTRNCAVPPMTKVKSGTIYKQNMNKIS